MGPNYTRTSSSTPETLLLCSMDRTGPQTCGLGFLRVRDSKEGHRAMETAMSANPSGASGDQL